MKTDSEKIACQMWVAHEQAISTKYYEILCFGYDLGKSLLNHSGDAFLPLSMNTSPIIYSTPNYWVFSLFHFNEGFPCLSPGPSHKWHYYRHRIVNPVMIKLIKSPKYGIDINDILYFRQVRPFCSWKNVYWTLGIVNRQRRDLQAKFNFQLASAGLMTN